ncbi:hypothetical protein ARMSODRAFT_1008446 [Armillaria solidipes]|uniref:Mid2 domain-containing protein n=1 Tax=Armillaria solidipes TaxID=1076256 RepID=A0A2H3AX43_9AGAR|nr:hypothetical protein ARMSODRAFT_1008446 [Armillaria solidipes]
MKELRFMATPILTVYIGSAQRSHAFLASVWSLIDGSVQPISPTAVSVSLAQDGEQSAMLPSTVGMSIGPFHAISFLSLASISMALQIHIADEKHIFQGQNTTVALIHEEGDPADVFLKKVAYNNITSNDALQVTNFTTDAQVNITFNHSCPEFEVQDNHHPSSYDDQKGDSSSRGLIIGAVLGSVASTVIILLTVYLIFFRSRRRRSVRDQVIHHSLTVPTPFLKYITTKCSPRRKPVCLDDNSPEPSVSGSIAQRDSLQTFAEESTPHESTVLPLPPPAMSNESAGEILRLRAHIQQLILERASSRTLDNESDPPPAYVEEVTENVLSVELSTS